MPQPIPLPAWLLGWALGGGLAWLGHARDGPIWLSACLWLVGCVCLARRRQRGSLGLLLSIGGMCLSCVLAHLLAQGWTGPGPTLLELQPLAVLGCALGLVAACGSLSLGALLINLVGYLTLCAVIASSLSHFLLLAVLAGSLPALGAALGLAGRHWDREKALDDAQTLSWCLVRVAGGVSLLLALIGGVISSGGRGGIWIVLIVGRVLLAWSKKKKLE